MGRDGRLEKAYYFVKFCRDRAPWRAVTADRVWGMWSHCWGISMKIQWSNGHGYGQQTLEQSADMNLCVMDLMVGVFFAGQGRRLVVALTGALASKVGKVVEPLEARVDLWDVIVLESADQRLRMCAKGISSDESASSARINTARIIPVKDI